MDLTSLWLWLGFAVVTAGLAETKGRSRWYWLRWGILIGPFATALVVAWPRLTAASPVKERGIGEPGPTETNDVRADGGDAS